MEDIEYLEEYEDLVLPALNSAAAAAASSTSTSITKTNTVTEFVPKSSANDDGDGSSSSLDQDIFNCLFDDHSDDDNDYTVERLDDNTSLNEKRESSASLDSLDLLVDDLGEQVAKEVELQKAQEESNNKIIALNPKAKETPKVTPTTTKPKTFATNSSVVPTVSLNTNRNTTATQQNRNLTINKQKSVATVRPTVQNKQQQRQNTNLIQRSSFIQQQQRPTSSTATTSSASFSSVRPTTSRSVQLPVLARKPLSSTLSSSRSTAAASSTSVGNKFKPNPAIKPTIIQRPATIVKPERIITKDPAEDPLNLDDLSEEASDSDSVSDISGETYNSISDFYEDDDEDDYSGDEYYEEELEDDDISNNSQIIELSNDSSGSTLNLEDLRAATPSPVISQDQDLPSSSFGFNKRKTRSPHLLRNRDILQGLLTRGEKPKLLELINQYAHTNNSVSEEEDEVGEVIDITGSRENLIENISTTKVTILSDTIITPISATTTKQDNKLSTTNRTITPTHSSKDKSKTVKISIRAMENIKASGRDLRSPGAASDDSYLSAVEELLEESYAEAMKKMNDSDDPSAVDELLEESYAEAMKKLKENSALKNQGVGADIKVEEKLEVVGEQEKEVKCEPEKDKPKTSKIGIVIEYDDNSLDQDVKEEESKLEIKTTENKQNVAETEKINEMETKQIDKKDDLTKDKVFTDIPLDKIQQSSSKLENASKDQPAETLNTENETVTTPSDSIKSPINESPSTRKKKRFRNLISPETTENTVLQLTEETVIDADDFKGFEEDEIKKTASAQVNVEKDQTHQKNDTTEKLKLSSCGSFKSPTKTHKSKDKSSRDSSPSKTSKTSSDRSRDSSPSKTARSSSDRSKDTKSKSSRDNSKDSKSSRDSSRESKDKHHKDISKDKSSRESKDRSRESSKDSSKHTKTEIKSIDDKSPHKHTTETSSKHHKDHRKSRDSKDSSKSRESSKSRDNKELKEKKSETKDSHRSSSIEKKSERRDSHIGSSSNVKKDNKSVHISRDKTDKDTSKDVKVSKEKEINKKQTEESKDEKIVDKTKDSKDIKSATEKVIDVSKSKEIDNKKKTQSTSKTSTPSSSGKSLVSPVKVFKQSAHSKETKDKKELPSSRDSSKDRKDVSKTKDTTLSESDKKSKELKKSETSSRESSKDRKDIKNTKVVKNINKIHADQQSPKTNPKDLNKSSTSQDIKNTNETSSLKDLKSAEQLKDLKSSHDNKVAIKSKESSKETKKDLNDNKTKQKSSNLKDSISTSNSSKSTKDVFDKTKNEKNTTSIEVSKNQDLNVSFEIVEKKKETNTVVTKSEKLKSNETTDNQTKAKESKSAIKKPEKFENISENKAELNKDKKEIKTRSDKIILGTPVIKLTRIEDIKPKFGQKIAEIRNETKPEVKENKTTKKDNTKMEESKSKESKAKAKIEDLKLNKTEKDTEESKELVTEKKDGEPKCDIVAKKTETRKIKIKRGSIKSAEDKAQVSKDSKSKVINSERETEITQEAEKTKSEDTKCVADKIVEESVKAQADASVHDKNEKKSDPIKTRKSMGSKSEAKASQDDQLNLGATQDEPAELKSQKDTSGHDKNEENTMKTLNSKSEDAKVSRDKEIKLKEKKDEENKDKSADLKSQDKDKSADLKSQEETNINEDKLEPMITRKSLVLKTEEPKSIETATATEKGDNEVKDTLEESITKPMKTRKSFESKPEKLTSSKVAVTDETTKDKSIEIKLEPRKTRNRHDSKTEDQIPKETSDNSEKTGKDSKSGTKHENTSDLVEQLQPEPRITRNRQEEHKSKETGGNPEKKLEHSKSETTSENPNDKSGENKTEPIKTRNRHDSKTEEQKSEEVVGIAEKSVEETKCETKSVKTTNLLETSDDKSEDIKPETRKTRNRHDSKTEEEKSKEMIDKSVNVVENAKTKSEESKLEKRKTRNRQDPKTGEKKSEETIVNADKKFEESLEESKESVDKTTKESVESKPEPRITRNRNDTKIKEQKSAEISDNAEQEVDEHKTEAKSEKTAGLPDKAEEESLENKPETRITRNRHDTKIGEQKSTEISGNAEQKVEQHKTETKSDKTAGLADKVKDVVLENKPEPRVTRNLHDTKIDKQKPTEISGNADQRLEEKKSETKPEKSVGLADKSDEVSLENKPEPRITRNRQDTKIEEPKSTEASDNAEQMVEEKIESSVEKTADKDEETLLENKPEPRITRNRRDSKTEEQKSAEGKNNEEKKLEEIETSVEKSADEKNKMVEGKAELRKIRSRHDLKTEEQQQISVNADKTEEQNIAETIDNAKETVQENVKDESLELKPETRKPRNRHDSNTEEQQLKETSSNVEQQLEENKNETKSEKTAGLVDKVIDESFENKPETRKTRNRNVLKTDEQKSEEISGNVEKNSEETKLEKTVVLAEVAKEESLENKPEPRKTRLTDKKVEETKNEHKSLKTVDITEKTAESEASKPEMEKTSVLTETAKDESLENKPELRKTRNAEKKLEETKNENKSHKTVDIAERTTDESEANKSEIEKTAVLEETAKGESLENKPEPRKTRNADKKVEETKNENISLKTVDISEKTTDKSEASKTEMVKTAILGEIDKEESLENKPEPRKTRNADKKVEETNNENKSLKTVDIAEKTTDKSEANKPEIEKTTVLEEIAKEESLEKKPEPRKTRNADKKVEEIKNDNKSVKTVDIAEKTTDKSQENKPTILGEIPKDESLENKPEPRKTRNADKKVEETKNENKSLKTVDISEKTTDKSEENKLEPRRTRNRYDSKTEDHNTSGNFDKKLEATKSRATTPNKTASLMKKTKVESAENKAEPRKTRSLYDLKSEELKSVESSQNVEETVELTNIETEENAACVKSDEAENKDSVTTVENIAEGEKERNQEAVKLEESKTNVKENDEKPTAENKTEDLITLQIEPDIDKVLNNENNTSAEKQIDSKEPNTSSSETSSNEKLENITESKTGSEKDKNETSSRVETSTSEPIEGDLIKDNISTVSDSSSISTATSISSSDTPTRRTLRKRGTESPFPENDNTTKKIFKEPPAKSTMGTPKTAKNEKSSTDVVSPSATTSKRNLRSPCPDADTTLNLAKKPRLESPGRKSARFRHFNEDCLEEIELPVLTAAVNDFPTDKEIVSDPAPEVSQSPRKSIRREISQDKNLEHTQEPTDKKQDKKESTKTSNVLDPLNIEQTSKQLLQGEVLNIETVKEKQENVSATKSSVSAKKSLRSEEVQTPKGNKKTDDKVKLDSAEPVETKLPLKKLHRGEVVDIETLETNPTESVDTSSQILEHEDISNAKPNINVKKSLRSEDAKIIQTPIVETKIDSAIKNKSANKSPGAVLTFSDWLKNKNQASVTEPENIPILQQSATGDTAKVEPKRKSRMKTKKLPIKTAENTKSNVENKESTENPNNNTQEETALLAEKEDAEKSTSLLKILENTSTMEKQSTPADSMEITQTSLDDDNSLLQPSLIQITEREVPKAHRGRPFKKLKRGANSLKRMVPSTKKKATIEKPQEIQQVLQDKITLNETINEENNKSNTSLDKSNPTPKQKSKRTERDLLIESMSKEMKEGGIQDLLNFDKHVKRQRSASRKKLTSSTEHLNTSTTETAEASISSDVSLVKESPKIIEFSDMPDVAAEMPKLVKENIKSPTKKKAATQQNVKKSKKSLPGLNTSINAIIDDDDGLSSEVTATFVTQDVAPATTLKPLAVEANTEAVKIRKKPGRKSAIQKEKEISKQPTSTQNISAEPILLAEAVSTKSRKSLKTKDTTNESMTTATISSKDVTTALPVVTKSRKSLGSTKQQPVKEAQVDLNKSNRFVNKVNTDIFKTPKLITQSTILNKIPTVENIKQLYADTNKRPQSRNLEKFKQSKILSSTFKCRKLRVRLNRSVVKRYWKSLKQRNLINPALFSAATSQNVRANIHKTNAISGIRHNKEANLRIKSVVSTVNVVNEPIESLSGENIITQDSVSHVLVPRNTLPSNVDSPPYFVPTSSTLDSDLPLELKYEFVDENPKNVENSILPDTPTLLARAQTITQAAQHALSKSITPTDIRLVTSESSSTAYVSSFGVAPTALNNKGTCLYTFLHPAKYNRNHSNVLLDFCCPNLDGPMPAIDPTRIHAQVQTPVIELPACIVLTTKVVTRAELESKNSSIPAIIRKKAERIRSNIAAHHNIASAAATAATQSAPAIMTQPHIPPPPRLQPQIPQSQLSSTMNALAKHLPPTTTITPKIRPAQPQPSVVHPPPTVSVTAKGQPSIGNRITNYVQPLRSNLRRFDVLQKQLCQPFDRLTFVDRHRIIESIITSGKLSPKDLERTLILMEEYLTQISLLKSQSTTKHVYAVPEQNSPTTLPSLNQMPQLQPAPNIIASASSSSAYATASKQLEQLQNKSIRKIQTSTSRNTNLSPNRGSGEMEQRHVPIYDTDRNIIGYQLQPMSAKPAYTKSTMSSRTSGGIMSTSLENQITSYSISKRPMKRPAQDSPRVFYTTPPQHTSTPIATNPHVYNTNSSSSKALSQKTHQHKGSIVTTVRSSGGSNQSGGSETITTTTMATVKRVTRSTATGSKIIIVSKSNQSSEETILPDIGSNEAETAEIKNETDIEDFIG